MAIGVTATAVHLKSVAHTGAKCIHKKLSAYFTILYVTIIL